jgi:hypothetical protein
MARLAAQLLCLALVASFGGRGAAKAKMSRARREAEARVSRCLDLGFTDALECPVCDDLFDATDGDAALDEECRSCCRSSGGPKASSTKTFAYGTLEVDRRLMPKERGVSDFVDQKLAEHRAKINVENIPRQAPQLRLYDVYGDEASVVSVSGWTTDQIVDFLTEKVTGEEGFGSDDD